MKRVVLHRDAISDIQRILLLDDLSAKRVLAVLEQAKRERRFFEKLRQHGYRDPVGDRLDVKWWRRLQKCGQDVWRVRLPDLELSGKTYRVVYAFKRLADSIHVLAIVPREEVDYDDPNHPFSHRIQRALDSIGP